MWLWLRPAAAALIGPLALGTSMCCKGGPKKDEKQSQTKQKCIVTEQLLKPIGLVFGKMRPYGSICYWLSALCFLRSPEL